MSSNFINFVGRIVVVIGWCSIYSMLEFGWGSGASLIWLRWLLLFLGGALSMLLGCQAIRLLVIYEQRRKFGG